MLSYEFMGGKVECSYAGVNFLFLLFFRHFPDFR